MTDLTAETLRETLRTMSRLIADLKLLEQLCPSYGAEIDHCAKVIAEIRTQLIALDLVNRLP